MESGPVGGVAFGDANAEDTTVQLASAGVYTLKLTVTDAFGLTGADTLSVNVLGAEGFSTVRDEFEVASVSNNDGTVNWSGDWIEISESNGPDTGKAQIGYLFNGSSVMRLRGSNRGWIDEKLFFLQAV